MRTVTVELKVKLTMKMDEGVEVNDVIGEMDYEFNTHPETDGADIEDTEIMDYEVVNSR